MARRTGPGAGVDRGEVLGPFLEAHWVLPVPAQGEAPAEWPALERSLAPSDCGACHPKQFAEWSRSLHAGAFSPGFAGQLIEGSLAAAKPLRACQRCHTPLEEQQPVAATGEPQQGYDAELRSGGLVCAGCHVRAHARHGPPRRVDAASLPAALPHGGFQEHGEYQKSSFCAPCHQFFNDSGANGKPIENTWSEWRESPHAAEGETCQSCHMPDRAHLWRGIHDPEMVRGAVRSELQAESQGDRLLASLTLHSEGVGHAFPTYVTPRVFLTIAQLDAADVEVPGTEEEFAIGRKVNFSSYEELFDTRIPPRGSARLDYDRARSARAVALVGRVTVDPDFHYRGVFSRLLPRLEDPDAKAMIAEALRRAAESTYVLSEQRSELSER